MRLPGSDKVIVGYDLGKDYAQISCYVTGRKKRSPHCLPLQAHRFIRFPRPEQETGVNQWFYGSEALRHAEEEEGILVEHLLKLAKMGNRCRSMERLWIRWHY